MKIAKSKQLSILILTLLISSFFKVEAQVTIGSLNDPARAALLELKTQEETPVSVTDVTNITSAKGGLGLPRVYLSDKSTLEPFINIADQDWIDSATTKIKEKHAGLVVYNIYVSPDSENESNKIFKQGVYVWNGATWSLMSNDPGERYFYIPSFNIPLTVGSGLKFNLYNQYASQFTKQGNSTFISNNDELTFVPPVTNLSRLYQPEELDYIITYYDTNILENVSIDDAGEMTYSVKTNVTNADSFMNVVFVIK